MFRRLPTQPLVKKISQQCTFSTSFRASNKQHNRPAKDRLWNFFNIDLRTLLVSLAVISMGVGSYYSYKKRDRELEFKEKRREERKETIQETKKAMGEKIGNAKNWFNSKRNKSPIIEEQESKIPIEEEKKSN